MTDEPRYSDADLDAAFETVVDEVDYFETPAQREAFVDGAMALHMRLQNGTLPSKLRLAAFDRDD